MHTDFKNKWVVITGASSGIGEALAECFAKEGAHLILCSLPEEKNILEKIKKDFQKKYHINVLTVYQDFAKPESAIRFYNQCKKFKKPIYCLVNNAGIILYGNFYELSHRKQKDLITINLITYFTLMRYFLEDMIAQKEGIIINISSVSAFLPTPHHAIYGASKAFVQSLSEAVDQELKGTGVRIVTINPSYTDTPMLRKNNFPSKIWWYRISGLSKPEEIAQKATKAVKKGKKVYIPGMLNSFIHLILPRFIPRRLSNLIAYIVLHKEK